MGSLPEACSEEPCAPPRPVDGAPDASSFPIDRQLSGYLANATGISPIALADFRDEGRLTRDLVILYLNGRWSSFDRGMLADVPEVTAKRVIFVSVLGEGATPGAPAGVSDLVFWHNAYLGVNMMLDAAFATVKPLLAKPLEGVPTVLALDAHDLQRVEPEKLGALTLAELSARIDAWRKSLKPL